MNEINTTTGTNGRRVFSTCNWGRGGSSNDHTGSGLLLFKMDPDQLLVHKEEELKELHGRRERILEALKKAREAMMS